VFQAKVVEKIKTHVLFKKLFFPENCAIYDIKVKVKQPRYRPGVAQRVPGS
jgi:uncharacterized Fe-S cluster-containing MiaB family protein